MWRKAEGWKIKGEMRIESAQSVRRVSAELLLSSHLAHREQKRAKLSLQPFFQECSTRSLSPNCRNVLASVDLSSFQSFFLYCTI